MCPLGDCFLSLADFVRITQKTMLDGLDIHVQLAHERHARGSVQFHDIVVEDAVQVLDRRPEAVAMSRNDDPACLT